MPLLLWVVRPDQIRASSLINARRRDRLLETFAQRELHFYDAFDSENVELFRS